MVRMLFVCSANRIRSPYAAAVASEFAVAQGLPVVATSAGFGPEGLPAMNHMVAVARKEGIDLGGHRSRRLTGTLLGDSDLILTMTGQHVLDLADIDRGALGRALTIREAATAAMGEGAPSWNAQEVRNWAATAADRPLDGLLSGFTDVDDPVGASRRVHRRTATELRELLGRLFQVD